MYMVKSYKEFKKYSEIRTRYKIMIYLFIHTDTRYNGKEEIILISIIQN